MPKSWIFRASIATRIRWIMAGLGLSPQARTGWLSIPARPLEAVAPPEVAGGAGKDAPLPRGFGSPFHFDAHGIGARLEGVEPRRAVHRRRGAEPDGARRVG